jgi:hypothetical protein
MADSLSENMGNQTRICGFLMILMRQTGIQNLRERVGPQVTPQVSMSSELHLGVEKVGLLTLTNDSSSSWLRSELGNSTSVLLP